MIAVLSDIHANLPALEAVLADMPQVSGIWVTGDILGGASYPCETMDRLANLSVPITGVLGNHEKEYCIGLKRGEHPDWRNGTQMGVLVWTVDQLKPRHWKQIEAWPTVASVDIPHGALLFHGTPENIRGKIYAREQAEKAAQGISQRWLVCGHTHKSRLFRIGNQTLVNVGSVGISLDGIAGVACYTLIDEKSEPGRGKGVSIRHVAYDAEKVAQDMRSGDLSVAAPGGSKALALEILTGGHYLMGLLEFCTAYAEKVLGHPVQSIPNEIWREAEKLWDGSEWLKGRTL